MAAVFVAVLLFGAGSSQAATTIPGLYVVIDPYNPAQLKTLQDAAGAADCAHAEPFCTRSDGIFLNVDWCRFEGYPDAGLTKDYSCHYTVTGSGTPGPLNPGTQSATTDDSHACAVSMGHQTSYDECSSSDFSKAQAAIVAINALRPSSSPLKLDLGLMAGVSIPETYLLNGTFGTPLSIPFSSSMQHVCGLESQVWNANFRGAYVRAYDEFINYTAAHVGQSQIKLIKITPLNATTLEYYLPGFAMSQVYFTDPMTPDHDDVVVDCSGNVGAQKWIDAYGTNTSISVIQAMEQTLGAVVGNVYATLTNLGDTDFGISIATNNAQALPQINCGTNGAGTGANHTCAIQANASDQWSPFYLFFQASDLVVPNSLAYTAATSAAMSQGGVTYALTAGNLFINTTQLQDPTGSCFKANGTTPSTPPDCPSISLQTLSCALNDTASDPSSHQSRFTLNNTTSSYVGVGAQLGVQTMTGLDNPQHKAGVTDYCTASGSDNLGSIFAFGIKNGAQFIEATFDIASDPDCGPYLAAARSAIEPPPKYQCQY